VVLVLFSVCVACTAETPDPQPKPEPEVDLTAALGMVRATDETRAYVEFVDQRAVDARGGAETMNALGHGDLDASDQRVVDELGVFADTRTRILVGAAPATAGLWLGEFDRSTVDSYFAESGAEKTATGDTTLWRSDADALRLVHTAPGTFAWSATETPLTWLINPGDSTLAEDETTAALATCLDDPAMAVVAAQPSDVTLAVGVRFTGADAVEVACAHAPNRTEELLTAAKAAGLPTDQVTISRSGETVRIEWTRLSGNAIDKFYPMLRSGELATVFGA
jgi:hypothetical protein